MAWAQGLELVKGHVDPESKGPCKSSVGVLTSGSLRGHVAGGAGEAHRGVARTLIPQNTGKDRVRLVSREAERSVARRARPWRPSARL